MHSTHNNNNPKWKNVVDGGEGKTGNRCFLIVLSLYILHVSYEFFSLNKKTKNPI